MVFSFAFLWSFSSEALTGERYSELEKIGFAFHGLAKFDPDFELWIKDNDQYKDAFPIEKIEMMQEEKVRLRNGYINYYPDSDLISLKVDAMARSSNYFVDSQEKGKVTIVDVSLTEFPENYFPFKIGDIWVAVVIKDFDKLTSITFTKDEYSKFAEKVGFKQREHKTLQEVRLDLKLRPISVDMSSPVQLNGVEMWLMMVDVAEMVMWKSYFRDDDMLFAYQAPWYMASEQKDLFHLYRE